MPFVCGLGSLGATVPLRTCCVYLSYFSTSYSRTIADRVEGADSESTCITRCSRDAFNEKSTCRDTPQIVLLVIYTRITDKVVAATSLSGATTILPLVLTLNVERPRWSTVTNGGLESTLLYCITFIFVVKANVRGCL